MEFTYNKPEDGSASVAVYVNGKLLTATDKHPNWDGIMRTLRAGLDPTDLFDAQEAVRERLTEYTDRVTIEHGVVRVDGQPVSGPLTEKIVRVHSSGRTVKPLVLFLERLHDNPSHRSREQLYRFLDTHGFVIDEDGRFIAYKGIKQDGKSGNSGTAFVDGTKVTGRIPNAEGTVITMPRSEISDDPNVACHAGLHAGTFDYASIYGPIVVTVSIDPADVVSVPSDANVQKIRTERYEVLDVADVRYDADEDYYKAELWSDSDLDDAWQAGYADGQLDAQQGVYA